MRSQRRCNQLREERNRPMQSTSLHLYGGGGSPSLPGRRHDHDELDHDQLDDELDHDELDDEHHHHLDDDVEHDVDHQQHDHDVEHAVDHQQHDHDDDQQHDHDDGGDDTVLQAVVADGRLRHQDRRKRH